MNYLQKKKLAFMSIVNSVKGFVRTITGVLPLTLEGCVDEESIIDYTLYGQSVQNGTPTPETPIEVESVGEKTRNLFDINSAKSISGINPNSTIQKVNGNFVIKRYSTTNAMGLYFDYHFKAGKYALKIGYLNTNYSPKSSYIMYFADKSICVNNSSVGYPNTVKQLNIPEDMKVQIAIYTNDNNVVGNECTFSIMLSEGYEDIPYEPYGYKIPIKVSGKNLLNPSKFTGGSLVEYNGVQCYQYTDTNQSIESRNFKYNDTFKENTRYTFTIKLYYEDSGKSTGIDFVYTDGTKESKSIGKSDVIYKFTTASGKTLERIIGSYMWGANRYMDLSVTQLEEGTTATDYEPYHEPITTNIYLDEPLRKVGDYADYIKSVDLVNGTGTVASVVKEMVVDSSTKLYYSGLSTDSESAVFFYPKDVGSAKSERDVLSNYFPTVETDGCRVWRNTPASDTSHFIKATNEIFEIDETDTTNDLKLKKIKAWLDAQKAINPVLCYYILKTPTETPITLPPIPTFKGTSIISADTTIQPSSAEIEYYSNAKE